MTLLMRDMENIEKGRMEGRKEGREEGRRENRKQVAEKMLEEKIDAEIIIKVTSLTEQELKQIEKNMLVSL